MATSGGRRRASIGQVDLVVEFQDVGSGGCHVGEDRGGVAADVQGDWDGGVEFQAADDALFEGLDDVVVEAGVD